MRGHLVIICLLASTFCLSAKSKPHSKHHGMLKSSHTAKEKDGIMEEANEGRILPTLVTFEASSAVQEDEETSSVDNANANANKEDAALGATDRGDKTTAVLLSEEELAELLKKESDEDEAEEMDVEEEEKDEEDVEKVKVDKLEESVEVIEEGGKEVEGDGMDAEMMADKQEGDENKEEESKTLKEEDSKAEEDQVEESITQEGQEETEGSTESEIPRDLDYASDSDLSQPLSADSSEANSQSEETLMKNEENEDTSVKAPAAISDEDRQDVEIVEALEREATADQDELLEIINNEESSFQTGSQGKRGQEPDVGAGLLMSGVDLEEAKLEGKELEAEEEEGEEEKEEEEEKGKNGGESQVKEKTRKRKNQRARKHAMQRDEAGPERSRPDLQEPESHTVDNTVHKAKRKRTGKWAPLVGMNPVQIRATVDLYPSARPSLGGGVHLPEDLPDPCDNFRCKRGKTCKLDGNDKPACVCQEPSDCPSSVNEFDHVCGTDNNTYDTSCELFAAKCSMEGTKRGHKLHLDYTGPCKFIALCVDAELVQFPLRMRDWLKNVLLQLYEHDTMSPGFLTAKQRVKVKKIYESERRLHAGDHPIELLAQDFEKNYNMYIYPVHWQFAQMDQHPSDRFLSHSELAPLRVPLVPMEHCTSRFFQECDADRDKQVSFKEWAYCFGIKDEDIDVNLLF